MRKYTLLYTPYGPARTQFKLTLNAADLHDAHHIWPQPPVGDPQPIHKREKVTTVLRDLRRALVESDRAALGIVESDSEEVDTMAPQNEGGDWTFGEPSSHTQTAFGTQIAHRMRSPSKTPEKRAEGPLSDKDSNAGFKLLGLLNKNGGKSVSTEPRARREGSPNIASPKQAKDTHYKRPHESASGASSAGGFVRKSTNRPTNESVVRPESKFQPTSMPPLYQDNNPAERTSPSMVRKSIESLLTSRGKETSHKADTRFNGSSQSLSNADALKNTLPDWLDDTCRAHSRGRVPAAQIKLLSSWQKHRAGTNDRFPSANIPIHVLNALKMFKLKDVSPDTESSDEEDSAASEDEVPIAQDEVPIGEDKELSDSEQSDKVPWSSSPLRESPERPNRAGPALPPDSSLQSKNAGSQSEPQDASSGQAAQRTVAFESSNEKSTTNPPSSPPPGADEDDDDELDMAMELDIPRGLGEEITTREVVPNSGTQQVGAVVQVVEAPYPNRKNAASASVANTTVEGQPQTSSGTSKDTTSTSIVYSTYKENPLGKDTAHNTHSVRAKSGTLPTSLDGHRDITESEDERPFYSANDVGMEDAYEEQLQHTGSSSPHLAHQQHMHASYAPSQLPDDLSPQHEHRQQHEKNQSSPSVSPRKSPMSAQAAEKALDLVDAVPVKRKMETSPLRTNHRPSKRRNIKFIPYRSISPVRDVADELRREKEQHLREFTEKTRIGSMNSGLSDNDTMPGARDLQLPLHNEVTKDEDCALVGVPSHQTTLDTGAAIGLQKQPLQFTASGEPKKRTGAVSADGPRSLGYRRSVDPSAVSSAREDMDMEVEKNIDDCVDIQTTAIDTTLVNDDVEDVVVEETVLQTAKIEDVESDEEVVHNTDSGHAMSLTDAARRPSMLPASVTTIKSLTTAQRSDRTTTFETFKRTYPTYTGDMRHFLGMCKTMDKLDVEDKMVPKWQWDDFIIRNRTDYKDYVNQCLDNGEIVEPYYRFYKDNIWDTKYNERVIQTRETLLAAIQELESGAVTKASANSPHSDAPSLKRTRVASSSTYSPRKVTAAEPSFKKTTATKASIAKTPMANLTTTKQSSPSPSPSVPKKRQSLPSAFGKKTERSTSVVSHSKDKRPILSRSVSSNITPASTARHSTSAKPPGRVPTSNSGSTRPSSGHRTSSRPQIPTEPTGDPFRDFFFAQSRATSFTGSTGVRPPSSTAPGDGNKRR